MNRPHLASLALLSTVAAVIASAGLEVLDVRVEPRCAPPGPLPFAGKVRRPRLSGPPSRAREEARRRKQMARAGLPVVEPVAADESACVGVEGGAS